MYVSGHEDLAVVVQEVHRQYLPVRPGVSLVISR